MENIRKIAIKKKLKKDTILGKKISQLKILKHDRVVPLENPLKITNKVPITLPSKVKNKNILKKTNNINQYKEPHVNKFNKINMNINTEHTTPKKLFNPKLMNINTKFFDKLSTEDIYICSVLSKDFNIHKVS